MCGHSHAIPEPVVTLLGRFWLRGFAPIRLILADLYNITGNRFWMGLLMFSQTDSGNMCMDCIYPELLAAHMIMLFSHVKSVAHNRALSVSLWKQQRLILGKGWLLQLSGKQYTCRLKKIQIS